MKLFRFLILFVLLIPVFSPLTLEANQKRSIHAIQISGRKWINLYDLSKYYNLRFYINGNNIYLYSKYTKVVFNMKKRLGSFNGVTLTWFFKPMEYKKDYYLSEQDFIFLLDPLLRPQTLKGRPVRTVMIDAGHGGKDVGAIGVNKKKEKDITLAIALKLRKKLIRLGYAVRLTRSGDTFPTLQRRVQLWQFTRPRPDLFISIHCNAAKNSSVSGIETFAVTPSNAPSTADAKPENKVYSGNYFNRRNTMLAYYIQRSLCKSLPGAVDRGVKHARFYVIRNVTCPAVLIETGFISNKTECSKLSSDSYQERVADSILTGILYYSSMARKR